MHDALALVSHHASLYPFLHKHLFICPQANGINIQLLRITMYSNHCSIVDLIMLLTYSRLSLSRLRLSRTTAYLEEKIWSLFKHRDRTSGNKILWIRGEIAPQEQFLPFPTIISIYISN